MRSTLPLMNGGIAIHPYLPHSLPQSVLPSLPWNRCLCGSSDSNRKSVLVAVSHPSLFIWRLRSFFSFFCYDTSTLILHHLIGCVLGTNTLILIPDSIIRQSMCQYFIKPSRDETSISPSTRDHLRHETIWDTPVCWVSTSLSAVDRQQSLSSYRIIAWLTVNARRVSRYNCGGQNQLVHCVCVAEISTATSGPMCRRDKPRQSPTLNLVIRVEMINRIGRTESCLSKPGIRA